MAKPDVARSQIAASVIVAALALGFSVGALAVPSLKAMQTGSAHLQLGSAPYDLRFAASKSGANARAVNMASADFNTDGYADLVSGYAQAQGGFIAVHLGNAEAYSPSSPAAFANLKRGIYPPGFVSDGQIWNLPVAPELLVAGDFNADGEPDLVFAQRGDDAIYFMPGSRAGFGAAQKVALNGTVDAIAAGEIDLPNASLDLAVAISAESGASLKIYRDGIANKPLDYPVPAAVTQLAIGNLDDSLMGDVAILAGGKVSILHGYNQREGVPGFSRLQALDVGAAIQSFALGNFIWDREGKTELALLQADGALAIGARGALNTTPLSLTEARDQRRAQIAAKSAAMKYWQPGTGGAWAIKESNAGVVSKAMAVRGAKLLRANLAGQSSDDLIVVDSLTQTLKLLTVEGAQRKSYSVSASSSPMAALAIPTSSFVLPSLIVLGEGAAAPSVLPSVPKAIFAVNKISDTNDGLCNADCSLREAIVAANAAAGADIINIPAGTYTLTIANAGGLNEDNSAQGDLDINSPLTITGAGLATTIIQGGTTNANGIDKVLAFSPFCTALNMSLSDVTVRFGRNSQLATNPDFSYTGGGIDVCNAAAGTFSMSNVLVDQNTNLNGYGGGVNFDSLQPANGSYSITGSTISGNSTTSAAAVVKNGGGINLFADQHSVTITNTAITGNISAAEGGGVYTRHTFGGAILIQGSTINSNVAASRGGGVSNSNFGVSTLTLNNDGFVQNNISQGTVAGTESRGGGIFLAAQNTSSTTVNEMSITGNTANTGTFQGGGGVATIAAGPLTLTFNRIAGNTAGTGGGAGLHNAGATVTGTRNWWGCNAGPTLAPCDLAVTTSGTSTLTPRLQLAHTASPIAILIGQTSTLTADFLTDSGGAAVALANLDAMIGTAHAFGSAVLGTLSAAQTTIQANATATATFTGTGGGAGSANSVVDAQSQTANITITVPTVSIAVSPASVSEDGATNLTYTVTLSQVVPIATSVNFSIAGTAASGTDYAAIISPLVIPANALTGTITVDPTVDGTIEADETAILTVAAGTGYTVGAPASATGTILNDDVPSASIAVAPVSVTEDGAPNLIYTVTLNQSTLTPTSLNFTVAGTATSGTDYAAVTSPLVIPGGSTTGTITVNPTADATIEANETVILTLAAGAGYTIGAPASATGTILNDDLPSLSINDVTLAEGNAGSTNTTFTVSLSAPAGPGGVTFDIATANSTATAGTDYAAQSLSGQAIPAGSSTYAFTVLVNGDTINEPSETFFVNVTNVTNAVVTDGQGQGTITNDDPLPTLSIDNASLTEGNAGSANMVFTVTLSAASGQTVSVNFATANGTATAGSDFTAASGTLTFTAGQTTQPINVPVLGDTTPEANETFTVGLSAATNATIVAGAGAGIIIDDDTTLSINDMTVAEGNAGTSLATFTVSLSQPAGVGGVSFDVATANGTATAGSDYMARSLTAQTIAAGASTYTFDVTINGDTLNEPNETFFVNVSNVTGAGIADGQGLGTITNDDPLPSLSINNVTVTEGNAGTVTATFTVTLSAASGQTVTVNYVTADGIATAGSDYVATSGTLTFAAGQTTQPIGVTVNGDILPEANETFTVGLSAETNATIAVATGTGTITNDDVPVTVGPGSLPAATVAAPYAQTISASGGAGAYTFAVTAGALPAGITLSTAGALAGTPTAGGTFNFTITATDSSPAPGPFTGSQAYTLTVNAPTIVLPVATLPGGVTAVPYTANLTPATGGTAPYSYAVTAGALPGGILMSTAGAFSGTPTAGGTFNFTVTATDSSTGSGPYTASRAFSIAVTAITIAPPTLPAGTAGVAYTQTLTASGGSAPYAFNVSAGALPAGLTLSGAGVLSGTPTAAGTFNFTASALDTASATGTLAYTLTIAAPTLTLAPTTLVAGIAGTAYAQTITASGGIAAYTYAVTTGALPAGLSLSTSGNLAGTPTVAGSFNFTITATDSTSGTAGTGSRAYTLVLAAPTISLATAQVPPPFLGTPYSATLVATGGTAPYTYAVTAGILPAGLSLSPAGLLSGTPNTLGSATFTIMATDALGFTGTRVFNLTVQLLALPVPVDSPLALATLALGMLLAGLLFVRRRALRWTKGPLA